LCYRLPVANKEILVREGHKGDETYATDDLQDCRSASPACPWVDTVDIERSWI
jgi:hypothetical protein